MKECNVLKAFIDEMSESVDARGIHKIDGKYVHKTNKDYVLISEIKEIP